MLNTLLKEASRSYFSGIARDVMEKKLGRSSNFLFTHLHLLSYLISKYDPLAGIFKHALQVLKESNLNE